MKIKNLLVGLALLGVVGGAFAQMILETPLRVQAPARVMASDVSMRLGPNTGGLTLRTAQFDSSKDRYNLMFDGNWDQACATGFGLELLDRKTGELLYKTILTAEDLVGSWKCPPDQKKTGELIESGSIETASPALRPRVAQVQWFSVNKGRGSDGSLD